MTSSEAFWLFAVLDCCRFDHAILSPFWCRCRRFELSPFWFVAVCISAVAEKPRDALCPSVVSFSSVIHRSQSFIMAYCYFRLHHWLPLRATKWLLQRVVQASCHTLRRRLPPSTNSVAYQRLYMSATRRGPSQLSVMHLVLERFTARDKARYWLRIAISVYTPHALHPR